MKIYSIKGDSEEQIAVVTARTSRSPNTFDVIQEEIKEKGHVAFIKTNVLGYGHDSVAEMAQCPVVGIENISDLAANVIATADPQLRVQMTSTRYQDMASRTPWEANTGNTGVVESGDGRRMRDAYMRDMAAIEKVLEATDHPRKRTLQCDIARCKLPAGIATQTAIRADARTMRDVVAFCLGHKLGEVREAGELIRTALRDDIETLFDRHVVPAYESANRGDEGAYLGPGDVEWQDLDGNATWGDADDCVIAEINAWRESGYRRRFRMAAAPHGPWLNATLCTDWGAYRDLRRNRTITQTDLLPNPTSLPNDALWAFRELYPDVCDQLDRELPETTKHEVTRLSDPYVAPMGSMLSWAAGAHIFNWAYGFRLRSAVVCHPGYSIPVRNLMRGVLEHNRVADALGLVESKTSLCGVEFRDRVAP